MLRLYRCLVLVVLLMLPAALRAQESTTIPPFGPVRLYHPDGTPHGLILLISGDGGWEYRVEKMAASAASAGWMVAGIDIVQYMGDEKVRHWEGCPFEELLQLGRTIQEKNRLQLQQPPVLVGYSSGATLAYAALVESPASFAGAITLGFCPDLHGAKICTGDHLKWHHGARENVIFLLPAPQLKTPWIALQGEIDKECDADKIAPFIKGIPGGELVPLKGVGHGFNIPENWISSFLDALRRLQPQADSEPPPLQTRKSS